MVSAPNSAQDEIRHGNTAPTASGAGRGVEKQYEKQRKRSTINAKLCPRTDHLWEPQRGPLSGMVLWRLFSGPMLYGR